MYSTIQFVISRLTNLGYSSQDLLRDTGLRKSELNNPWSFINRDQYATFIENVLRVTNDPASGININRDMRIADLGLIGYTALSSQNFEDVVNIASRYRLLMDPYLYVVNKAVGETGIATLHDLYPMELQAKRFATEGYLVRHQRFCLGLSQQEYLTVRIDFNYPPPEYFDKYQNFFSCDIHFNQPETRLFFDLGRLKQPFPERNREVHKVLLRECELRHKHLEQSGLVKDRVYEFLYRTHTLDLAAMPSLDHVASEFCLSPRTFRRKLQQENVKYQDIMNNVLCELALFYIADSTVPIKQLAHSLGYTTVSNFSRAFKGWTGLQASDIRKSYHRLH